MKTAVTVVGALLFLAGTAHARPGWTRDAPGVDLGLRVGYAMPFGAIDGGATDALSNGFSAAVPLVLEAGWRFNRMVTVGALFQYGIATVRNTDTTGCGGVVSCSGSITRLGIEGIVHLPREFTFDPWAGIGTGYEWMNIDGHSSFTGNDGSEGAHGFELVTLQAGGDLRLGRQAAVGPFVSWSLARYRTITRESPTADTSVPISMQAVHYWLQLGVRGTFGF
jgi:hypothetical protein